MTFIEMLTAEIADAVIDASLGDNFNKSYATLKNEIREISTFDETRDAFEIETHDGTQYIVTVAKSNNA
jgi:hypothetical protein